MNGVLIRNAAYCVLFAATLATAPARADDARTRADQLVQEGATLGEQGRFADAIARFRAAEALYPRAIHDCNLGLAYRLWQRPAEAYLYFHRCTRRATGALPRWVAPEQRRVLTALTTGGLTPVEITPSPAGALVAISNFADGELFVTPLTAWLPPGPHALSIRRAGYRTTRVEITCRSVEPVRVTTALQRSTVVAFRPAEDERYMARRVGLALPANIPPAAANARVAGWVTVTLAAVALGVGGAFHGLASASRGRAMELPSGPEYDGELGTFQTQRGVAIGMYSGATALLGVGLYLLLRPADDE
jgi:hypothetical protein